MQLTLVVPELIWPEPDDRHTLDALRCPGLTTLIARSRLRRRPPQSLEATLADAFGLTENVPYAAFRLLGEASAPTAADGGCQEVVRKVQAFAAARSLPAGACAVISTTPQNQRGRDRQSQGDSHGKP